MIESIKKYAKTHSIRKVLAAFSGGSDSCCMLSLLKEAGLDITALHCNFNLRGEESIRDRDFAIALCREMNIPIEIREFDVLQYVSSEMGISIEMACRELRYEWFYRQLDSKKADRIAVAHNADDNIETLFINLLRGSGTRGLSGMDYDNRSIWRPLLYTHKNSILNYLEKKNIPFITDSSNLNSDYRRNFLRNEVIPLIKSEWKGFDKALDNTITYLKEENKIIEENINKILTEYNNYLPLKEIKEFIAPVLLVRRFIETLGPYTTTANEVISAIKADKPHSPEWKLKKGVLKIKKDKLILKPYKTDLI